MYVGDEKSSYIKTVACGRGTRNYRKFLHNRRGFFMMKRAFDIVFSFMVIVCLLSWLIPVIGLLIKLSSKGPVFFAQKRVGFLGKSFTCYKFRTMRVNQMADTMAAQHNDTRITRIGQFLRKSNLDELPQFINVFLGQMSIVGPRPHMYADCAKFSDLISNYKFRNLVRPGITGLAQVKGFRGPVENFDQIFHRYQFDAFYIRNINFWLDVRIIRKTLAQTLFYIVGKTVGKEHFYEYVRDKKVYRKVTVSVKQIFN